MTIVKTILPASPFLYLTIWRVLNFLFIFLFLHECLHHRDATLVLPTGRASHHSCHWCSSNPSFWPPAVPHSNLSILCRTYNLKAVCNLSHQCSPFQTREPDRHTETPLVSFLRGWKWVTHPLVGFSPPRTAESRVWHHTGGMSLLQSRNKSGLMQHGDVRGGQGSFGHVAHTVSSDKRFAANSPLFVSQYTA